MQLIDMSLSLPELCISHVLILFLAQLFSAGNAFMGKRPNGKVNRLDDDKGSDETVYRHQQKPVQEQPVAMATDRLEDAEVPSVPGDREQLQPNAPQYTEPYQIATDTQSETTLLPVVDNKGGATPPPPAVREDGLEHLGSDPKIDHANLKIDSKVDTESEASVHTAPNTAGDSNDDSRHVYRLEPTQPDHTTAAHTQNANEETERPHERPLSGEKRPEVDVVPGTGAEQVGIDNNEHGVVLGDGEEGADRNGEVVDRADAPGPKIRTGPENMGGRSSDEKASNEVDESVRINE
ncbi:hypothetical protein SARC_14243, partial [Sphaeroforma arctica JP610]